VAQINNADITNIVINKLHKISI